MKKKLLIGPAGSGKTQAIIRDFEAELQNSPDPLADDCYLILPSHEHAQRMLSVILQRGTVGFFQRRVTTLNTLLAEVFGVGDEGVAGNVTRFLIMRELFEKQVWEIFSEVQHSSGFYQRMLAFIGELKEGLISLEVFREYMKPLKQLEPDLAPKYQALIEIYEAYEKELSERGLRDRADNLNVFRSLKEDGALKQKKFKKIWLDGFFDFSETQLAYLELLSESSEEIIITLAMDSDERRYGLFETAWRTREMLEARGFEAEILPPYDAKNSVLHQIERRLFLNQVEDEPLPPSKEVTLYEAIGMEGEIEMIARTIQHMERNFDYRYSDFAILLRQIGEYEKIIQSVFGRYDIPVEIHERDRLRDSALIQTIRSLLEIYLNEWSLDRVMQFLKSNYVRVLGGREKDYYWVNALEHYAMKSGVYKDREVWLTPWCTNGHPEWTAFDKQKEAFLTPLVKLEKQLREAKSFSVLRDALIEAVRGEFKIFKAETSDDEYVRRDVAAYKRFLSILDEIENSFMKQGDDESLDFEAFCDRFFRLIDLDLYSLRHRNTNRVQVYNVSLARQKQYEVVFVAGLLEKKFPVQVREDPVLSDWERRLFNASRNKQLLKERQPTQSLERYLFYIAVTRARHKLFLTYPRMDLEGKSSLPSSYVFEVKRLFSPKVSDRQQLLNQPYPAVEDAVNQRELELGLVGEIWHKQDVSAERQNRLLNLIDFCRKIPEASARFDRTGYIVRNQLTDESIDKPKVFRTELTSPSALEDYAKCHFKYYAKRVLKLDDPTEDQNVTARGTILHEVLEECFRDWQGRRDIYSQPELGIQQALKKLKEVMAKYPLMMERPYQYDLERYAFEEQLRLFLEAELTRLLDAPLQPKHFELGFGEDEAGLPPLIIQDEQGEIRIRGKIDRIDLDENNTSGIVIDYKRSAVFEGKALEHGTALQLPIYILVLTELLNARPVGGELYSIRQCEKKGFYHEDYTALLPGLNKRRLILPEKDFERMIARSRNFIRKFVREMKAGDIRVQPRSCDSYCPYDSVCRVEKWRLPLMTDQIKAEDEKDPLLQPESEAAPAEDIS